MLRSDSEHVREFNIGSGQSAPSYPEEPMDKKEVLFLIKMMLDEIMELGSTVSDFPELKYNMIKMITDSKDLDIGYRELTDREIIAEQSDAIVDTYYYSLNAAIKKGINISEIFHLVHKANMDKRDANGIFQKRSDGKIIKPLGWKAPDILEEINRQFEEGSFKNNCDHLV